MERSDLPSSAISADFGKEVASSGRPPGYRNGTRRSRQFGSASLGNRVRSCRWARMRKWNRGLVCRPLLSIFWGNINTVGKDSAPSQLHQPGDWRVARHLGGSGFSSMPESAGRTFVSR
jgi:hypothetical protein